MKSFKCALLGVCFLGNMLHSHAETSEDEKYEHLRVRAKAGYHVITGSKDLFGENLDKVGVGLDFTRRMTDHFDLGFALERIFFWSGSHISLAGLTSSFAFDHRDLHFYFGTYIGQMMIDVTSNAISQPISSIRFALGPQVGVDATVTESLFLHASIRYLKAIGPEKDLGALSEIVGVGFKF